MPEPVGREQPIAAWADAGGRAGPCSTKAGNGFPVVPALRPRRSTALAVNCLETETGTAVPARTQREWGWGLPDTHHQLEPSRTALRARESVNMNLHLWEDPGDH